MGTSSGNRFALALVTFLTLLTLTACGGDGEWAPQPGPYTGSFFVGEEIVGTLTLTANATSVTGTGSLTHNEQPVAVAIAATLDGQHFDGFISNASLGEGDFDGNFTANLVSGTFTYADNGGISTTTGTWTALREE